MGNVWALGFAVIWIALLGWHIRRHTPAIRPNNAGFATMSRIGKLFAHLVLGAYIIAWSIYVSVFNDYMLHKPRKPDAAAGRMYGRQLKGATIYPTHDEKRWLDGSEEAAFACFSVALVLFGIAQHKQWQMEKRRYERPTTS